MVSISHEHYLTTFSGQVVAQAAIMDKQLQMRENSIQAVYKLSAQEDGTSTYVIDPSMQHASIMLEQAISKL